MPYGIIRAYGKSSSYYNSNRTIGEQFYGPLGIISQKILLKYLNTDILRNH